MAKRRKVKPCDKDKPEWEKLNDVPKRFQLRKDAKFNYNFVEIAARLKAIGFSHNDIAFALGVTGATVLTWKARYPQFRKALDVGKDYAKMHLIAQGIRAAAGYDYEDANEKYIPVPVVDDDGNPTGETELILKERSVFKKHQPANAQLIQFFLGNFAPDEFKSIHKIEVDKNEKINVSIDGQLASKQIQELCGKLLENNTKQVDSRVIENEDIHK